MVFVCWFVCYYYQNPVGSNPRADGVLGTLCRGVWEKHKDNIVSQVFFQVCRALPRASLNAALHAAQCPCQASNGVPASHPGSNSRRQYVYMAQLDCSSYLQRSWVNFPGTNFFLKKIESSNVAAASMCISLNWSAPLSLSALVYAGGCRWRGSPLNF